MAHEEIFEFLRTNGLADEPNALRMSSLTGGISSDVWKVETSRGAFVVKRALPQLRVAETWSAPLSRSANEAEWMITVGTVAPNAVPKVLARDSEAGLFAMTYFDPGRYPVWKQQLRAGYIDISFAASVGQTIAAIHMASAGSKEIADRFANDAAFHSLRIEPYFEATARRHVDLEEPLLRLAHDSLAAKRTLVHGDVSPKNILAGPYGPVFLDAECAWFGEPAFDLAFCLSHLLLKCIWTRSARDALLESFDTVSASYLASVSWEPPEDIERRTARLLPALLLARVDGKSPVEYLQSESDKNLVRRVSKPLITSPPRRLTEIRHAWLQEIST